jgi:hypothetical protein
MTLERTWGTFKFNVYFFSGMLFTTIGAFGLFYLYGFVMPEAVSIAIMQMVSTNYINLSMFLAFAVMYPNTELYLMLAIPVKIKYLGMVSGGITLYMFIAGNVETRMVIGASMLNFVIFAFFAIRNRRATTRGYSGQRNFRKETKAKEKRPKYAIHRCTECDRTDLDYPELEFRYCSKCNGNYEYCQDHLFTHVHRL